MADAVDDEVSDSKDAPERQRGTDADEAGDDHDLASDAVDPADLSEAELQRRVEEKYDFDDFGPQDMAEMSPEEWDAAFDAETWITGADLLDRVERDLARRVADREVFAVVERTRHEGEDVLLAYSDEGYAMVHGDGTVEGFGTVMRDVEPTVALCSMESYDAPEAPPENYLLPEPGEVPEGSGELGNLMLQIVAGIQFLAGVGLIGLAGWWGLSGTSGQSTGQRILIPVVAGLFLVGIAVFLFLTVANARLSDRFRAEEYRDRLRAVGLEDGEKPDFLPTVDGEPTPLDTAGTSDASTAGDASDVPTGSADAAVDGGDDELD